MLGSNYRELIVPKRDNIALRYGGTAVGILLIVLLVVIAFAISRMVVLLLTLPLGFGVWWFYTHQCIEYEYIIAEDQLTVTKLLAQSKRKEMLVVSMRTFKAFGKLNAAESLQSGQTLVLACSAQDASAYYAGFEHETLGMTRLVFTPNEDILLYLEKHLPRTLHFRYEAAES